MNDCILATVHPMDVLHDLRDQEERDQQNSFQ